MHTPHLLWFRILLLDIAIRSVSAREVWSLERDPGLKKSTEIGVQGALLSLEAVKEEIIRV